MKTILIDLDGVLNEYNGVFDKDFIPKPRANVEIFLSKLSKNFQLKLFTTRSLLLASKWLIENDLDKYFVDVTNVKNLSWLMIDDRCLKFDGNYEHLVNEISNFQPWWETDSSEK